MKKSIFFLFLSISFLTAWSQEVCECKKWEKQYTEYNSYYRITETKYDYYTGCIPPYNGGYRDMGYDYPLCKEIAKRKKIEAENSRLFELNKKKNKTKDGYKVIDWWEYADAPPSIGVKGNNKRYWTYRGDLASTGDEINNKREGVWFHARYSSGRYSIYLDLNNNSNDLWVYYRNDSIIYADTIKFTINEISEKIKIRDAKIALENERIAFEEIKIQNDKQIENGKNIYRNGVSLINQFNFYKYIFKTTDNSDRNSIGYEQSVWWSQASSGLNSFDEKFQSKKELIELLQNADELFNNACATFPKTQPELVKKTKDQIGVIKSYLDSLNNIDDITFDLDKIYPKIYLSVKELLYKTIKSSISETCSLNFDIVINTKSDGKAFITFENVNSDNQSQYNEVINRVKRFNSIMPVYYMGTIINTKSIFKIDINANTSSVKFLVVDSSNIKLNGWNGDEDNLPRKRKPIDHLSLSYTESHSLSDQYKSGLKLLTDKPKGVYAVSFTDFNINGKANHIDYLSNYRSFGGPANCLYSVLIPGLGDMKISRGRDGWGKLFGVIACGVTAYYLNDLKNTNYEKYKLATEQEEIDKYYDSANLANVGAWSMAVIGTYVWLLDISEVYNRGVINRANERDFKKQEGVFKMGISMSSINQNMYPVLGLRYNLK
jgi:hypothetical protein